MLGFNHALDSSCSSLSISSEDDEIEKADPDCPDKEKKDDKLQSNVFLKHMRKCFISIDDNNYCEQTILPDLKVFSRSSKSSQQNESDYLKSLLSKRIDAESYEYAKIFNAKENRNYSHLAVKNPNVKFFPRMNSNNSDTNEIHNELILDQKFEKSESEQLTSNLVFECIKEAPPKVAPIVSPLTLLLNGNSKEKNDFLEYLRHEAHIQDPNQVQKFRIFLPMSSQSKKNFMLINIYKNARISDLIGIVCCKYVSEKREPKLKFNNVSSYYLKIADDTGDIELELAPLESNQRVGRFGFNDLALVEKSGASEPNSPQIDKTAFNFTDQVTVLVHFTDDSPNSVLYFDSDNIPMEKVYTEILKIKLANLEIYCPKIAYRIEHYDQPGTAINIEKTSLNDFKSTSSKYEFYFFRENSIRKLSSPRNTLSDQVVDSNKDVTRKITDSSEYDVTYLSKWRKVPFKIEISKDNFELEEIKPVQITQLRLTSKLSNFYTIPTKHVVSCGYLREKEIAGKAQLRIIVAEEESETKPTLVYKHLDFECEPTKAEDIIRTFNQLILFCNSSYWKIFNQAKRKSVKWSRRLFNAEQKQKTEVKQTSSLRRGSLV